MTTIIWDWNGTLLDDLDLCISTINTLLRKRKLSEINHNLYKDIFSFPVKDYYEAIGFDFRKEDFAIPASEFTEQYNNNVSNCSLHKSAKDVLNFFKLKGFSQFVLSAMKQDTLEHTLEHNGIFGFFEGVYGLDNHYAVSKIDRGRQLITHHNTNKEDCWIIGDTLHDYEVAEELGIGCILVADGHQSVERLKTSNALIVGELKDLLHFNFTKNDA
jgi:phosphoglycolate phosphatase